MIDWIAAWTTGQKSSIAPGGLAFYSADAIPQWKGSLFTGALAGTALAHDPQRQCR